VEPLPVRADLKRVVCHEGSWSELALETQLEVSTTEKPTTGSAATKIRWQFWLAGFGQ